MRDAMGPPFDVRRSAVALDGGRNRRRKNMPTDVEAKVSKEDTKSGTTLHYELKNNTSSDITIELKEHPFDENGKKMGNRKTQIITVPANGTVKTKMSFPKDLGAIHYTYTDINHSPRQPLDPISGYNLYLSKMPVHCDCTATSTALGGMSSSSSLHSLGG
jgi:hypothetical protein